MRLSEWPCLASLSAARWLPARCSAERLLAPLLVAAATICPLRAQAGYEFTEIPATLSGLSYNQWASPRAADSGDYDIETGGAAAHDFDGDGWTDLVVSRFDNTPILYRNVPDATKPGGRRFVDVTAGSGLQVNDHLNGLGWADVDRDGRPDLYATAKSSRHYLFMNKGNGRFVEEGLARNAALPVPATSAVHGGMSVAYGDYDRDGYTDIAVGNWLHGDIKDSNALFQLLHNRGKADPGHFDVATYSAGLNVSEASRRLAFTPRFTDLDNDGWQDLALCSDAGNAKLFWNNKNGTFTDGTAGARTGTETAAMGNTVADFDRDGDLDWFVSSTYSNRLYRNRTIRAGATGEARVFSDATDIGQTGVRNGGWGWGSSFLDYDLDGWQDIVSTNGMYSVDRTMLWRNTGGSGTLGFNESGLNAGMYDSLQGKGIVVFDYDNNGAPDIFIVNNRDAPVLYRNSNPSNASFLKLKLTADVRSGVGSNSDAFGAVVIISDPVLGLDQMLEVSGGSNYLGQNDPALIFGLGSFTGTIDTVTVRWPDGAVQRFHDVAPNQTYLLAEGVNKLYATAITPEPASVAVVVGAAGMLTSRRRSPLRKITS